MPLVTRVFSAVLPIRRLAARSTRRSCFRGPPAAGTRLFRARCVLRPRLRSGTIFRARSRPICWIRSGPILWSTGGPVRRSRSRCWPIVRSGGGSIHRTWLGTVVRPRSRTIDCTRSRPIIRSWARRRSIAAARQGPERSRPPCNWWTKIMRYAGTRALINSSIVTAKIAPVVYSRAA